MLRPNKHSKVDQTIFALSYFILKEVKDKKIIFLNKLLKTMKTKVDGAEVLFIPALDLLFLLGLIEYHVKNDSIEYTGN